MIKKYFIRPEPPIFEDLKTQQLAYRQLFVESELGRKVLADIYRECSADRTAFNKDSDSQTHYNLGKQHLAFHIKNILRVNLIEEKQLQQPTEGEENE